MWETKASTRYWVTVTLLVGVSGADTASFWGDTVLSIRDEGETRLVTVTDASDPTGHLRYRVRTPRAEIESQMGLTPRTP